MACKVEWCNHENCWGVRVIIPYTILDSIGGYISLHCRPPNFLKLLYKLLKYRVKWCNYYSILFEVRFLCLAFDFTLTEQLLRCWELYSISLLVFLIQSYSLVNIGIIQENLFMRLFWKYNTKSISNCDAIHCIFSLFFLGHSPNFRWSWSTTNPSILGQHLKIITFDFCCIIINIPISF